jgi:AraC-like DNA-binding protein
MPEGTVCVLNPGEVHTGYAFHQTGWTYRMLYPDAKLLQQIASQITEREQDVPFFPELVINDKKLFTQILNLHLSLEQPDTSLLERESQLVQTLGQLILRHADARPAVRSWKSYSKYTKKVREYLDQHYDEEISLKQLARVAELSPYYLLRLFKKEVGVTPHIYLTYRRIIVAKRLLVAGHSIAEVTYETGFVDQSHLTNRFKHIIGVTPGQYRADSI